MDKNTSIGAIGGIGLVVAIAFIFSLFPAESDNTIILVNKQGTDPVNSCAPGNGLILAQNLTDLCDVVIVSPSTGQLLRYNGSFWVNVASSVVFNDTTTCNNIGIGSAFVCVEGTNVDLRSLLAGTGISVSNNTNTITVTNTLPENTVCDNQSTGEGLCIDDSIELKNLLAGSSISLSSNGTHITITNTAPDNTVCTNVGTGTVIYKDGECNFKTLVGSPDISITNTTNTVVIDYNGTHVTQVTSDNNNTIGVVPTTGNVVLYPAYELLCSTSGTGSNVTCGDFEAKKFLHVKVSILVQNVTLGTGPTLGIRFNSDTGGNYSWRASTNGGGDATSALATECRFFGNNALTNTLGNGGAFQEFDILNIQGQRKLAIGFTVSGLDTTPATIPGKVESNCKWGNATSQITTITLTRPTGTATFITGTQISVWGHD